MPEKCPYLKQEQGKMRGEEGEKHFNYLPPKLINPIRGYNNSLLVNDFAFDQHLLKQFLE